MRRRFPKLKVLVWLFVVGTLGFLIWIPVQNVIGVMAVQSAVQRDWEISFEDSPSQDGKPPHLPEMVDSAAQIVSDRWFGQTRGYEPGQVTKTRNRDLVFRERYRALFRGPIDGVHIFYPEAFSGDLGAALARFPHLRRVTVSLDQDVVQNEAEWTLLCTRLRKLSRLEEVELDGNGITDDAIAPLAGHPNLRSIIISYARVTTDSARTFATMPLLTKLQLNYMIYADGADDYAQESKDEMIVKLPRVTIQFDH